MFKVYKKSILSVVLATTIVYGEGKEVKVFANELISKGNITHLNGGVVVEYDGDLLSGKNAIYIKDKNQIILNNSVSYMQKSGKSIRANQLIVNLDDDNITFKDFFQIDQEDIWISSTKAQKENNDIKLSNALFSSCQVTNPDWMVGFDKATYNTKDKILRLEDAKVYIKDIPIFYFPYLVLPLSKERRSGLLKPKFGTVQNEGFLYAQPYFWAISPSQDLEITPQIRTKRGIGIYSMYRFVHQKDAHGEIKFGYFKDKASYTNKYSLKYNKHYGIELNYQNDSLIDTLSKNEYENKLYINGISFSDGDYVRLQDRNFIDHHKIGSYYESRLNYFIKNNYFYSGINFRYFKSDIKPDNSDTIQILPRFNIHIPYRNLIYNNISYSLDFSATNYTRDRGSKAVKLSLKAPIEAHFSFFDGFLSLNLSEELESIAYDFYNVPIEQKKYSSIVANHKIELTNEVSKLYDSGIHTSLTSLMYTKSHIISDKWMKYYEIPKALKEDFIDSVPSNSKLTLRTHQYWKSYNDKLNIDYILEGSYLLDKNRLNVLNQELSLKYKNWKYYSNIGYSFIHHKTTGIYNKISYNTWRYGFGLGYLWKKDFLTLDTTNKEISFDAYYKYSNRLKFSTNIEYSLKDKNLKNWELSTNYNKKCWSVDVSLGQNTRPVIKRDGKRGSISNNYISVQFTILPFGISYSGGN